MSCRRAETGSPKLPSAQERAGHLGSFVDCLNTINSNARLSTFEASPRQPHSPARDGLKLKLTAETLGFDCCVHCFVVLSTPVHSLSRTGKQGTRDFEI